MKFHMEIQSEHFGQGRDLSIEGNVVKFFPVGAKQTKTHYYSFLKDSKIQNAATTDKHMDRLIKILKKKNVLKDRLYKLRMDVVLSTDLPPPYGSYLHYLQSIILSSIDRTVHRAMVSYKYTFCYWYCCDLFVCCCLHCFYCCLLLY
jgi:hypothetical protein